MAWKPAKPLSMRAADRELLGALVRGGKTPQRVVLRARIVLGAADGRSNNSLALELGVTRPTILLWRERYAALGIDGLLKDAPRPGGRKSIGPKKVEAIINATLHTTPRDATRWSCRTLARAQSVSPASIQRIWDAHGLQPHRVETFKLSRDPEFVHKLRDVVGLYLNPPDKAIVLCVDEKSQIQALDRAQPALPMRPGAPERQTHDYVRRGTTTLFAAMNVLQGTVIGSCQPQHRHREFIAFMEQVDLATRKRREVHLVMDNYGTHKHPDAHAWFAAHPKFHVHFIPTSSSWLNLVERWFAELPRKRVRRGDLKNVPQLVKAIKAFLRENNRDPRSFIWTATPAKIMRRIAHCKEAIETGH